MVGTTHSTTGIGSHIATIGDGIATTDGTTHIIGDGDIHIHAIHIIITTIVLIIIVLHTTTHHTQGRVVWEAPATTTIALDKS